MLYRLVMGMVMLSLGSYYDLRYREIPDRLWVIFSSMAIVTYVGEGLAAAEAANLMTTLLSVGITSTLSLAIYYSNLLGGADAKALIVLSLILPVYSPPGAHFHPLTSFMTLTNTLLLTLILPLSYLVLNLSKIVRGAKIFAGFESEPPWRKAVACLVGYRLPRGEKGRFVFVLEKVRGEERKFDFSLRRDLSENFREVEEGGDLWVSPGIPMLVPMTLGFLITLLFGDLLTFLLMSLFP